MIGARGELEVEVDNRALTLERYDVLRLAPGVEHSVINSGFDDALIFEIEIDAASRPTEVAEPVVHLRWREQRGRLTWDRPGANQWGTRRGVAPDIGWPGFHGHVVVQPPAQSCPWHSAPGDVIHLQLSGELEYTCAGQLWPQQPYDVFVRPAGAPYIYTNVGFEDAIFFVLAVTVAGQRPTYYAGDPGWPPRADAALLVTG